MKNSTAFKRVQRLLANPKKWTKGWYARDKDGNDCRADDPGARSFCISGALGKTLWITPDGPQAKEIDAILREAIPKAFKARQAHRAIKYNDACTHRRMLQWLDRAIKIALGQEAK